MADEHGKGEQTHGPVTDKVAGGDPKKRKLMMIGVGVVGLLVVYMMSRKGKGAPVAGPSPSAGGPPVGAVTADVTVPSGDRSPSDMMAQFANTIAADQSQQTTGFQNQFAAMQKSYGDQLAAFAGALHQGPGVSQPGGPPTPAPAPAPVTAAAPAVPEPYLWPAVSDFFGATNANLHAASDWTAGASDWAHQNAGLDKSGWLGGAGDWLSGASSWLGGSWSPAPAHNVVHDTWPTAWQNQQQAGITNPAVTPTASVIAPAGSTSRNGNAIVP